MTPEATQSTTQQLLTFMQEQIDQVNGYLQLLDSIKQCVISNDVDELNRLLTQGRHQPDAIENTRQQQYTLLQSCGYAENEAGLRSFIKDNPNPVLVETRQRLTTQLEQLDKSLLVNGLLITKNQQRVRQSIQILSGHESSNPPSTYSRQGNLNDNRSATRRLARA